MLAEHAVSERDFRATYRAHYGLVWHTLVRFGVQASALEDAVQDVFVIAYRRRDERSGRSTKAWLYGIARRVAANHRRGNERREHRHERLRATVSTARPHGVHEAIHELDRYLSSLEPADRELFILSELEGMSGPEIAAARGRKVQTIYTRIRKLRHDLAADVDVERTKAARPRATARSWAALAPMLVPTQKATGVAAVLGSGWFLGSLAVAATMVVGVGVARSRPAPSTPVAVVDRASVERDPPVQPQRSPAATPVEVQPAPEALPGAVESPPLVRTRPQRSTKAPVPAEDPRVPAGSTADSLDDDVALIRRASRELAQGRSSAALELTQAHAERFPDSPLGDLRVAVRIDALCRGGDVDGALGEYRAFASRRPTSPVIPRIEKSCVGAQENPTSADTTQP